MSGNQDFLGKNYPNPVSGKTTIPFRLNKSGKLTIKLYNIRGSLVQEIASGNYSSGENIVTFDSTNLPSGIYFYQLESSGIRQAKKMIIK
ncbi:MAG: T9SS type A sorting domain-containing protein [Chryseobacterium sp.]|nr:MAG: T9SS type A sorting domain-containing protein [Chryseobacterium sp.]